ncbi:MAG TPA: lipase family protein [Candidatus Angelobacter sp.]
MSPVAYSPLKDDLFFPCKNAQFFAGGAPTSEAALCAEMSRLAYCSISPEASPLNLSFDQPKIAGILANVGFSIASFHESAGSPSGKGAHCFVAMRQDNQLAVVAFRGTDKDDPTNVAADANALFTEWPQGGKVHKGFSGCLNDLIGTLAPAVSAIGCRVLFTGHSLGAALATLLASSHHPGALYTFGSPLVGDAAFVATLQQVISYRYVDCCDIVTRIPPPLPGGYLHVGKPYYIFENRTIQFGPPETQIAEDRFKAFMEYPFKYQSWKAENVGVRELADHTPVNYVNAVMAASARADGTPA